MGRKNNYSYIDFIKYPLMTDKSTSIVKNDRYTFVVNPKITKTNIKNAIEVLFDVKVRKINTCHLPPKNKNVNRYSGQKPHYKKAIVKLAKGYSIKLYPQLK